MRTKVTNKFKAGIGFCYQIIVCVNGTWRQVGGNYHVHEYKLLEADRKELTKLREPKYPRVRKAVTVRQPNGNYVMEVRYV